MDEPTRGVDVGAKFEIYEILFKLVAQGKSLLLVSSDLPELMSLSDRITVLSQGTQTATFEKNQFSQEAIMKSAISGPAQGII
jgi:ABC-type sugar transport system ATPase subunit